MVSTEIYTTYTGAAEMLLHIYGVYVSGFDDFKFCYARVIGCYPIEKKSVLNISSTGLYFA